MKHTLYRKNNFDQPCIWEIEFHSIYEIRIRHGIIGKTISNEIIHTQRRASDEMLSRVNAKRKTGYKYLDEIKDDSVNFPVEEKELISYLTTYLPSYRTTADGSLLAMLAKSYDNANNKVFKNGARYAQWKINGERCFITCIPKEGDLFQKYDLDFQSREGTHWKSLENLKEYLLEVIPNNFLDRMIEEHIILDGELYIPGMTINQINHAIKDTTCPENKLVQYWCYDCAIEDLIQDARFNIIESLDKEIIFTNKEDHLANTTRFLTLPSFAIDNGDDAMIMRDSFINFGFEGLILRDPNGEYQFGKRNMTMIKYKKATDGVFTIINVHPEGTKRPDIPLFTCKNDINDATFECHIGGSMDYQRSCLINKDFYIGNKLFIEFGERSGVEQVPFHIKEVRLVKDK